MKTSLIASALALTMGISSVASAQSWRRDGDIGESQQRAEQARLQWRAERQAQWQSQQYPQYQQYQQYGYVQDGRWENHAVPTLQDPYGHGALSSYRGTQPHDPRGYVTWQRGGYVPREYRNERYYVRDWRQYGGLYAPPQGYQWVQNDTGDIALMALATGLIANLLLQNR